MCKYCPELQSLALDVIIQLPKSKVQSEAITLDLIKSVKKARDLNELVMPVNCVSRATVDAIGEMFFVNNCL